MKFYVNTAFSSIVVGRYMAERFDDGELQGVSELCEDFEGGQLPPSSAL